MFARLLKQRLWVLRRSFGSTESFISVHMEKQRVVALEVEPECWILAVRTCIVVPNSA